MNAPIRWFSFRNWDRTKWRVDVTSHEVSIDLKGDPDTLGYDGLTIPDDKLVLIDTSSSRLIQDETVLHELMHVALDGVKGINAKEEEKIITEMAPRLYPILRKFGLTWPDRPEGFISLERRARSKIK